MFHVAYVPGQVQFHGKGDRLLDWRSYYHDEEIASVGLMPGVWLPARQFQRVDAIIFGFQILRHDEESRGGVG